jgi:hypothetical protein
MFRHVKKWGNDQSSSTSPERKLSLLSIHDDLVTMLGADADADED